jgi:hypothetical protein
VAIYLETSFCQLVYNLTNSSEKVNVSIFDHAWSTTVSASGFSGVFGEFLTGTNLGIITGEATREATVY